ncbi:MAG: acetyl-CoA carboxylase biotin carboxyl carrier protein [Rubellimicrobium sp.]|nr:acetyl-CoA carboxylase biotin carboxyl carrier protein [Rubellimicrobium sp.]
MAKSDRQDDVEFIRALAALLRENDLTEIEVEREFDEDDSLVVRVSRTAPAVIQSVAPVAPAPVAVAVPATPATPAPAEGAGDPAAHPGAVTSPMVGTVYLQAEPGSEPFVKIGQQVEQGDTLLIIEAMKTMNQIPAPRGGTVRRIVVEDGTPVEYGTPLMIIE